MKNDMTEKTFRIEYKIDRFYDRLVRSLVLLFTGRVEMLATKDEAREMKREIERLFLLTGE
jgi:hypothetical protein